MDRRVRFGTLAVAALMVATARAQNAVTEAICGSSYTWMNNQENQSPCLVAAYLQAPCSLSDTFDMKSVAGTNLGYTPPNATYQNQCLCSWAVYNTIAACTACQGQPGYATWDNYVSQCTTANRQVGTYYPNLAFSASTSIPFWATTDPSTWPGTEFSPAQAQALAAQTGHPDIYSSTRKTSSSKKSVSAGAVAGGVVGGIVALCCVVLAVFLVRRTRGRGRQAMLAAEPLRPSLPHMPASDMTYASSAKYPEPLGFSYQQPLQGSAPTLISAVTPSLSGAPQQSQYQVDPLILPPARPESSVGDQSEEHVLGHGRQVSKDSFASDTTGTTFAAYGHDRKSSLGAVGVTLAPSAQFRARFNPPPYAPTADGSSTSASPTPAPDGRRHRGDTISEADEDALPAFAAARQDSVAAPALRMHNDEEGGTTAQGFPNEKRRPL